ncbi:formylglycine-generating enzyme family protein [bacterium]|nr:formylglycine-generating enzyme family protein [bacterium]
MTDLALALDSSEWSVSAFLDYLKLRTSDHDHQGFVDHLRDDLGSGMVLLILDKLEGVFPESRREVTAREEQLERFFDSMLTRFKGLHLLILTRRHWMPRSFLMASVEPLSPASQESLLAKFFTRFPPSAQAGAVDASPQAIARDGMAFLGDYAAELAGNPRFVTLFATLRERRYGDLYRSIVMLLLHISQQSRVGQPLRQIFRCTDDELLPTIARLLSEFAFQVIHEYPEGMEEERKDRRMRNLIRDVVGEYHDESGAPTDAMIQYLTQESGVFVSPPLALDFASQGFKAYFAAEHIKRRFIGDDARRSDEDHTIVRELIEDAPDVWFETLRIVADLFINPEDPSARATDLIDMVDDLVDDHLPALIRPNDARFYSAWFAARVAVDQGLPDRPEFTPRDRRDAVRKLEDLKKWLVLMLDMPKAPLRPGRRGTPDIRIRAESGRLLGRLGDPRPGVGLRPGGLPDILWVEIPGGAYTVGAVASDPAHPGALPGQDLTCPTFWLSRYPVTYAQFGAFVAAGGYADPAYWSPAGWQWKRDATCPAAFWEDPYWHVSNHPVVGVSWYEADAFCRWLDAVSSEARGIRLPSEAEWEIAARGQTSFAYPYGPDYDVHRANGRMTRLDRTSAVGLFNEGDSPFGLADMSGNVYEWCSDTFLDGVANAQAAAPASDITRKRALRGGSWRSYPGFLRVDARYSSYPYLANNYWGFRLACDDAPQSLTGGD